MGEIYCTECGEKLDDTVKFCSSCGTPVDRDITTNPKEVTDNTSSNNDSVKIKETSKKSINSKYLIIGAMELL